MSNKGNPAEVGPWAKDKLFALAEYLKFYTRVLKNKRYRTIFLDAFAGGGQAIVRKSKSKNSENQADLFSFQKENEEQEFIDGSPKIALDLEIPFDRYVFIDTDPNRQEELQALADSYGKDRSVIIRSQSCEIEIAWLLSQNISADTHRGVAFLDPFGAHLPWNSVAALADTNLFEVFINLPLDMAINRLLKKDKNIPDNWRNQINTVYGDSDWYSAVYQKNDTLFGSETEKHSEAVNQLLKLYLSKLKAQFNCVSKPKLVRNTKGHPLYYLIWAGPHRKGLEGADYILGMSERLPTGPKGGRPIKS